MTDIIKNVEMVRSADLLKYLRACPSVVHRCMDVFRQELRDLGAHAPMILAFGSDAHALIARYISPPAYSRLIRLTHYSYRISKEKYRDSVLNQASAC
jgi:hypothetical protein